MIQLDMIKWISTVLK
jgi:hypothetical protein